MVTDYKIARTTGTCGCGRAFAEGDPFVAALFENDEAFDRRDFCPACWTEPAGAYSFWQTKAVKAGEKKRENPMAVWSFFESLQGDQDPQRKKLAFLLSLTLQRKRILKMTGTKRRGMSEFIVLEKRPELTTFEVEVPDIRDDEMAALREELVRLLDASV